MINIKDKPCAFQFDPIIQSQTPGGMPFLTAVEICLDHGYGLAKFHLKKLLENNKELLLLPIAHVIIAASLGEPRLPLCLAKPLLVDSLCTVGDKFIESAEDVDKTIKYFGVTPWSNNYAITYKTMACTTVQELDTKKLIAEAEQEQIMRINKKYNLEEIYTRFHQLRWGLEDKKMDGFLAEIKKSIYIDFPNEKDRARYVEKLNETVLKLQDDPLLKKIKSIIAESPRNPHQLFSAEHSQRTLEIEKAVGELDVSDRVLRQGQSLPSSKVYLKVRNLLPPSFLLAEDEAQADVNVTKKEL